MVRVSGVQAQEGKAMITPTPDICRAAYDLLIETEPFKKWNLPDSDDITFKVLKDHHRYGYYVHEDGRHIIAISSEMCGLLCTIIATMAHEMIHLHARITCMETPNTIHNAAFKKMATKVAAIHGFDPKAF